MSLTLLFTADGIAVLEEDDDPVWASDDDDDFITEIGNDFLNEEDATTVLHYLVESDIITEHESQHCAIEVEETAADSKSESDSESPNDEEIIDADFEEIH